MQPTQTLTKSRATWRFKLKWTQQDKVGVILTQKRSATVWSSLRKCLLGIAINIDICDWVVSTNSLWWMPLYFIFYRRQATKLTLTACWVIQISPFNLNRRVSSFPVSLSVANRVMIISLKRNAYTALRLIVSYSNQKVSLSLNALNLVLMCGS